MQTDRPSFATSSTRDSVATLLRKERFVFRPQDRFLVFGIFFLPALQAVAIDEFYFILGIAFTATLAIWVPVIEWYQEADQMLHSLPVRRDAVVVARGADRAQRENPSSWAIATRNPAFLARYPARSSDTRTMVWTDAYSSLLGVLQ